ncbi:hypothetical protein QFC20_002620 [Naganishia adeliensis]|uniref:Uncharacterized protein n=1 Tax=Naganishia adeliensis TaxID=92952 RepID=A0ACC2WJH7_9TREE|nr:hypothetical protein QFC20_002620 [Naganishia adeliensis]
MNPQESATLHQSLSGVEVEGYIFLGKGQHEWQDVQAVVGQAVNQLKLKIPDNSRHRPVIYADLTKGQLKIWVKAFDAALDREVQERLYTAPENMDEERESNHG